MRQSLLGESHNGKSGAQENGLLFGQLGVCIFVAPLPLPDLPPRSPPALTMGLLKTYEGIEQRLRKFRAEMLVAARVVHDLPRRRVRLCLRFERPCTGSPSLRSLPLGRLHATAVCDQLLVSSLIIF
jgi:hypothetical protein